MTQRFVISKFQSLEKIAVVCAGLALFAACKTRKFNTAPTDSQAKEFVSVPFEGKREAIAGFRLARVEQLNLGYAAKGIPPISVKGERMRVKPKVEDAALAQRSAPGGRSIQSAKVASTPDASDLDERSNYHTVVTLGPLANKVQWDDLLRVYGGEGNVPFEAGKTYQITDFLNPKIQALMGKHFATQRETLTADKLPNINGRPDGLEVGQVTNCFQAAYEAVRGGADPLSTFFADTGDYDSIMRDSTYSDEVKSLTIDEMDPKKGMVIQRNKNLQPGDTLMVYGPIFDQRERKLVKGQLLGHIAVFLDDDLYFEKTGPYTSHLYRIVGYEDMVMPSGYNKAGDFSLSQMRLRRFKGKPRLPMARDVFTVASGRNKFAESARKIAEIMANSGKGAAPWSVLLGGLDKQLNVVNQPGMGGNDVFWWYRVRESALELDVASKRYKLVDSAMTQDAFWF